MAGSKASYGRRSIPTRAKVHFCAFVRNRTLTSAFWRWRWGRGVIALLTESVVILVVEDDQEVQGIVEDALIEGGFEPAIAPSGEEAVTLLKGRKTSYRALVTDVSLRGTMDGWQVAKQAREIDREFPIIYIT